MMNELSPLLGLKVVKSPYPKPGAVYLTGDTLIVGPPMVSREIYEIFHQGEMLKWYDYINEGPDSVHDFLFGYK